MLRLSSFIVRNVKAKVTNIMPQLAAHENTQTQNVACLIDVIGSKRYIRYITK